MSDVRDWCCPVVKWHGYVPVVSDHYSRTITSDHREHHGVDVMFRRQGDRLELSFQPGTPNGSQNYFMPDGVLVVAAADGELWSSASSPGGLQVVVSHGAPWATYYQHMSKLFVPVGVSKGAGKIKIKRGQPLGVVGGSPRDGQHLMHLHFEMWKNGGAEAHVDPEAYGFASWPVLTSAVTSASKVVVLALLFLGAVVLPRVLV